MLALLLLGTSSVGFASQKPSGNSTSTPLTASEEKATDFRPSTPPNVQPTLAANPNYAPIRRRRAVTVTMRDTLRRIKIGRNFHRKMKKMKEVNNK